MQVRDRIREVLVGECGVERLCCAGREWGCLPYAKEPPASFGGDSASVATSVTGLASKRTRAVGRMEEVGSLGVRPESSLATVEGRRGSVSSAGTVKDPRASGWRQAFRRGSSSKGQ